MFKLEHDVIKLHVDDNSSKRKLLWYCLPERQRHTILWIEATITQNASVI